MVKSFGLHAFIKGNYLESLGILPALALMTILAIIMRIDPYIRADLKRTMRVIVAVVFSLIAQNYLEYRLAAGENQWLARTLVSIYGYAVRPLLLVLFVRVTAPQKRLGWAWALVGANAAVNATALFSRVCFWIDENNHFQGGPLSRTCLFVSAILLVYWLAMTLRVFRPQKQRETWVPVLVFAMIVGTIELDNNVGLVEQPISYLTLAVVVGCLSYYLWLHLQFVREHEQALVAGQRVQLMLSQIKPHFLHNALTAIVDLCDTDAQKAKEATVMFSRYLRGNMDAIDAAAPISFGQELEHTRLYLEIEQLRFGDALQVRYDVACTDFFIPALTVEPLAENAVRHGVRQNPGGRGTVVISTRETPEGFEVCVSDDGPGFDPAEPPGDGRPHLGIANVRERLAQACGGSLEYDAAPGVGTTARIRIPKDWDGD